MGEAARRKKLGLPPRGRKVMTSEERREIVGNAVKKAIGDVRFMVDDMMRVKK